MKQITSLDLANEVIAKLVSMIEYEYEFAKFNRYEHAVKCANFDDKNEQRDYLLWSCGRLEAMNKVKEKTDEIILDTINNIIKTEGS